MRSFTTKFTTTTAQYDLMSDINVVNLLHEFGISDYTITNGVYSQITVIVDKPTQIKFNVGDIFEDFVSDVVYDSTVPYSFKHVYIKDNAISGSITFMLV